MNMEHRDWVHTDACVKQSTASAEPGAWSGGNSLVNRVPSLASASNRGVWMTGLPVHPKESYRNWSGMNMILLVRTRSAPCHAQILAWTTILGCGPAVDTQSMVTIHSV